MVSFNINGPARDRVMILIEEKDRIESEIREQTAVLETNNNVGMHDLLVDSEGFPRSDIDVYKVRHARHRIICLQNDHKNIMKKIERGLAEVHSDLIGSNGEGPSAVSQASNSSTNGHIANGNGNSGDDVGSVSEMGPFATVSFVDNGSPADVAGLCENDEILQFGSVNHRNFNDMTQIYNIVSHSVGQRVNVRVKRNHNVINLTVVPRPWSQPGLLGCHIQRINS